MDIDISEPRHYTSLSSPQIFIAYSMKNRRVSFHTVSDKSLRHGKAGYEATLNQHRRVCAAYLAILVVTILIFLVSINMSPPLIHVPSENTCRLL